MKKKEKLTYLPILVAIASAIVSMPVYSGNELLKKAAKLATRSGCASCHPYDGKPRPGPTWQGLYGSERPLSDGTTVVANEKYLRQAITDPDSQIPQGFSPGMMPTDYGDKFSEEQVDMLVEFIKKLK